MTDSNLISHKGTNIYYMDFSNVREISIIDEKIEEYKKYIRSQPEKSVYAITNLDNIFFNTEVFDKFTAFVKGNEKYVKYSAIIGLNGLVKIMFSGILRLTKRKLRPFNTKEEALDFLIKQK